MAEGSRHFYHTQHMVLHACAKSLQTCMTLCNPVDCSPPGSCVHGILQARILEWVAAPPPGGPPDPFSYPSCIGKIPWKRAWQPTSVFLPGKFLGLRSLEGYSPCGHKELDMTEVTEHIHTHRFVIAFFPRSKCLLISWRQSPSAVIFDPRS